MPSLVHQILVVDDDADLRRMYRTALTLSGFDVQEAVDGIDALRRLDRDRPDLIVLKIELPDISGVALIEEAAAHADTRNIPIVVISADATDLGRLGVHSVLRTPVSPEQLVVAVKEGLGGAVS